ncbi:MBL fold metallo-hydrolase [Rhodoferax sp. 4810]|uniref:MBL fold metallo-hydrolase n=1 Tax=Thiospirillum jenense TaxID=1653858 RepID=A0A839HLA3_9GAMM|nr:MBL fold metallo-hydrolase [Thiospirillum jenense]MBB1074333.1 MBL fold metallo-hydrolase [Rhodoferax jenense]MBB1126462.1 MBL fold metallo-hydrolase [Thiospirillum jenense]
MLHTAWAEIADNLFCIDTGLYRPGLACCYLIRSGQHLAFIDTGTTHTLPRLRELIAALGCTVADVAYVIPTHVHLDHAGGAGALMDACPNAQLVIHPKGAAHLIDPTRLTASAMAVYGIEAFNAHFGHLPPIPTARVMIAADDTEIALDGRPLRFIDTPGHANHHGCIFDRHTNGWFTGDTFGIAYPEFAALTAAATRWIFAPTTPVAFDPDAWQRSLDRLMAVEPAAMYLTHYGRVEAPQQLVEPLRQSIAALANLALAHENDPAGATRVAQLKTGMTEIFLTQLRALGAELTTAELQQLLAIDLDLNAQGLDIWLRRRAKATESLAAPTP